jgi:predicted nucleotidyltransferase component of viral defense system
MNQTYLEIARLMSQVAPLVFVDNTFALKGGTAINLFIRTMPRLSVDLDLVFTDYTLPRDQALVRINEALRQAAERLKKRGFQTHMPKTVIGETKLFVRRGSIQVKIEVNSIMRGTLEPVVNLALTPTAREILMADLEIPVLSFDEVYAGKLVAALDRQHPRDLFDVMQLFAHEGITPGIRRAFVVYLSVSNRPIHEVLFTSLRDIRYEYEHNFQGMAREPVALDSLLLARERMIQEIQQGLDDNERRFLLSLAGGMPQWSLLNIAHLEYMPGIQWKLNNLARLQKTNPGKFSEQADLLAARLAARS